MYWLRMNLLERFKMKSLSVCFLLMIVLAKETRYEVDVKLKIWMDALESNGIWLSGSEIECKFRARRNKD